MTRIGMPPLPNEVPVGDGKPESQFLHDALAYVATSTMASGDAEDVIADVGAFANATRTELRFQMAADLAALKADPSTPRDLIPGLDRAIRYIRSGQTT